MGIKENDIFLGVYFLLPNKVLKSMSGYVKEWYASSFFINEFISANCTFGNASHHDRIVKDTLNAYLPRLLSGCKS